MNCVCSEIIDDGRSLDNAFSNNRISIASIDIIGLNFHIPDHPCANVISIYCWCVCNSTIRVDIECEAQGGRPVVERCVQGEIPVASIDILTAFKGGTDGQWRLPGYCHRKLHFVEGGVLRKHIGRQLQSCSLHGKSVFWCYP